MKSIVVGDVHGRYDCLQKIYTKNKPDIIIQCGDFGYFPKFENCRMSFLEEIKCKTLFCDGNHEDHESLSKLDESGSVYGLENVKHIKRGTVLTINQKRVLFVGGASSVDRKLRTAGYDWWPQEIISQEDIDKCLLAGKVDVVVSHTCPEEFLPHLLKGMRIYEDKDPSRVALSIILKECNPDFWYFGHWHTYKKSYYKSTFWTCLDCIDGLEESDFMCNLGD